MMNESTPVSPHDADCDPYCLASDHEADPDHAYRASYGERYGGGLLPEDESTPVMDRVTGKEATAYTPPEDMVPRPQQSTPASPDQRALARWRERAAYWQKVAKTAQDNRTKERALARAATWTEAADELAAILADR